MCNSLRIKSVIVGLCALLLFTVVPTFSQSNDTGKPQSPPSVSETERKAIEAVVREYLLKNPSLLREMIEALRAQEERERSDRAAGALQSHKDQIYNDPDSPVTGNPNGDITIVAFLDYNCGYCRSNLPFVKALAAKDKMIRVIYKDLPVLGPNSDVAARAAVAARRQGKYSEFQDALFRSNGAGAATVRSVAATLGMDYAALSKDMADPKVRSAIERTHTLADALGIDGTPAYIIGTQLIPGAVDAATLDQIVAEERAKLVRVHSAKPTAVQKPQ